MQDGWLAGFVSSDPLGESDLAFSPIPYETSDVEGWLTGTNGAASGTPAIEIGEPILEGASGTNVDAYGFRRYQFQIVADPIGGLPGDYNGDGLLDAGDLDLQAIAIAEGNHPKEYDLTGDDLVDFADRLEWVDNLKNTWIGDSNLDLEFSSGDLVQVFAKGKYETDETAGWEEGDWDGNRVVHQRRHGGRVRCRGLRARQEARGCRERRAGAVERSAAGPGNGRLDGSSPSVVKPHLSSRSQPGASSSLRSH